MTNPGIFENHDFQIFGKLSYLFKIYSRFIQDPSPPMGRLKKEATFPDSRIIRII
jgi:hypothetical protein